MSLPRETGALKAGEECPTCGSQLMRVSPHLVRGSLACPKCSDAKLDVQKASEGAVPRVLGS